jgi:hypothetical protein
MTAIPGAAEFKFAYSDIGGATTLEGHLADARRIQNVLLGRKRAGSSKYGLDLRSYVMEIADSSTMSELEGLASQVIASYCPQVTLQALVVDVPAVSVNAKNTGGTVVVGAAIGAGVNTYNFALMTSQEPSGTVVSRLVL